MEGVTGKTNGSRVENDAGKETVNGQSSKDIIFGDLLWVKLHEASWWPAQVVDENFVSSANKPSSKGSSSDVLVRLYGSYIYKYVDIHRSNAEFKNVLMKNKFNRDEILKKTLEQDLQILSSSSSTRRQLSKSKAKKNSSSENDLSKKSQTKVSRKKQKQEKTKTAEAHLATPDIKTKTPDRVHHGSEPSTPDTVTLRPGELSGRRIKVMQSLGLVAPSGSPFPRNQVSSPSRTVLN